MTVNLIVLLIIVFYVASLLYLSAKVKPSEKHPFSLARTIMPPGEKQLEIVVSGIRLVRRGA